MKKEWKGYALIALVIILGIWAHSEPCDDECDAARDAAMESYRR